MNERMRFNPAEAAAAGEADARSLLLSVEEGDVPTGQLSDAIGEIVGLAAENRMEECNARLQAFCDVLGPALHQAATAAEQLEALRAKCALLSASLVQAEARLAVVESEGGEL